MRTGTAAQVTLRTIPLPLVTHDHRRLCWPSHYIFHEVSILTCPINSSCEPPGPQHPASAIWASWPREPNSWLLGIITVPWWFSSTCKATIRNTASQGPVAIYISPDAHCSRVQSGLGQLGLFLSHHFLVKTSLPHNFYYIFTSHC